MKIINRKNYKRAEVVTGFLFILPSAAIWIYWFLIPAIKSMRLSFYEYSYINPGQAKFVGISNFIRLFNDFAFIRALKNSFYMVSIVVLLLVIFSFIISVLINGKIKVKSFFRTSYYMPYVISAVAVSIFFMYFFVKNGLGTRLFTILGFENTSWFTNTRYALPLIILIYVWQQLGFYIILYISGLQNIPSELYEAAKIDGAGSIKAVWYITLPMVKSTTYLVITLGMINAFQIFDQIAAISKQSPLGSPAGSTSTVVTFLYQQSFSYLNMGYGSAAAMVLFFIIFVFSLARIFLGRGDEL